MYTEHINQKEENMILSGKYISKWSEGNIETSCTIDIDTLEIETEASDKGDDFEDLKSECLALTLGGETFEIEVEQGELTVDGEEKLLSFINKCAEDLHNRLYNI